MKKYGKYEKRPEGVHAKQPKVQNALLQTYFTSLLCMVLCVTMFFGTSYAWFTSEVTNTGNEIYIGVLDVELEKQNGTNWESLSMVADGVNTTKLYSNAVRWEPGYTSLETVRVIDKGDLAFDYALTFTDGKMTGDAPAELQNVAKWFDVWVFDHQGETAYATPASYKDITVESGWTKVGTLAEVLSGKNVFAGEMDEAAVTTEEEMAHTYTIALHMNGETINEDQNEALNALMGQKLELSVKLVATQRSSEKDGFGNADYDATMQTIEVTPENLNEVDFEQDNFIYKFVGDFNDVNIQTKAALTQIYDGSGVTAMGVFKLGYTGGVAHSYESISGKERIGSYTAQNFTAAYVCVATYNTTVHLLNNKVEFLNVDSANVEVVIQGNTVDGKSSIHKTYQNSDNDYGIYIYATDYTLSFVNNEVSNTKSHAIGINGRVGNNDFGDAKGATHNNAIIAFAGNKISGFASTKAALKIWGDGKYTPVPTELSDAAKALVQLVQESGNTIEKNSDSYNFCFDQVKITDYSATP